MAVGEAAPWWEQPLAPPRPLHTQPLLLQPIRDPHIHQQQQQQQQPSDEAQVNDYKRQQHQHQKLDDGPHEDDSILQQPEQQQPRDVPQQTHHGRWQQQQQQSSKQQQEQQPGQPSATVPGTPLQPCSTSAAPPPAEAAPEAAMRELTVEEGRGELRPLHRPPVNPRDGSVAAEPPPAAGGGAPPDGTSRPADPSPRQRQPQGAVADACAGEGQGQERYHAYPMDYYARDGGEWGSYYPQARLREGEREMSNAHQT